MFDPTGKLSRVIGNKAGGQRNDDVNIAYFGTVAQLLVGPDDTLFVGHLLGPSVTALSKDLRIVPSITSPYIPTMALCDGTFLVARQIQRPDLSGFPMHVMDRHGNIIRSFGLDVPGYRADQKLLYQRVPGFGPAGTIWAASRGRYDFERWDPSRGVRLQGIHVESSWFVPSATLARVGDRPNSMIVSLWEKDGVLWVLTQTADAQWKRPAGPAAERPHDPSEYDRTYDWILEAIDPASATVMAHRRFGAALWTAPPHFVVSTRSSPGTAAELVVSSVGLKRKEK
jgi:hypothetical protein